MTLSKLAKLANVSVSTASKAFSGSNEVSEETRNMIFDVARENHCFRKFYNAKYPKVVIAIIAPEFKGAYYTRYLCCIQDELEKANCKLCVSTTNFSEEKKRSLLEYYCRYTNMDGFETAGLTLYNFRWWAMNCIFCRNGHIHDIQLKADDTCIDENGNVCHGLARFRLQQTLVQQGDGIHLRMDCQDILVENVEGLACDYSVARINLPGKMEQKFAVDGLSDDICNITLRHIHTAALEACVRLLAQGGAKLHDILVEDVCDSSDKLSRILSRCLLTVRVNDDVLYAPFQNQEGDCYNITIRNVRSRAGHAVYLGGTPFDSLVLENIETFHGGGYIENHWEQA